MFHVALPPVCVGKRREGDYFFRDFASDVSHALFARRGHYGLCPCWETAKCSCGHTTECFTPVQQQQTADCGDAALW